MYPPLVHSAATFCGTPSDLYPASRTYIPKVCKPQIVGASARLAYSDPSAASILLGWWESDEAIMAAQGLGHFWGLTQLAGVAVFRDGSVAEGGDFAIADKHIIGGGRSAPAPRASRFVAGRASGLQRASGWPSGFDLP